MRASVATHARADASSYASRAMSRSKSSPPRTSGMTIANSRGPSKMSSSGATCGCIGSAERIASSARIARSRTAAQSALSMSLTATSARGGARARAASELRARLACSIDERLVAVDEVAPCEYEATLETPLACYPPEPLEAALDALRAHGVEPGASRALTLAAVDAALADRAAERETAEA